MIGRRAAPSVTRLTAPMTAMSGSPRRRPEAARVVGRGRVVAWALLVSALGCALALATCLPPDYEIAPRVNLPVSIDKTQLVGPSPDEWHVLSECDANGRMLLILDPRQAIVNPDSDTIFSYWIVNFKESPNTPPEQDDTRTTVPWAEQFTFDVCTSPENLVGRQNTIELVVRDRAPVDEQSGASVHDVSDGETTLSNVVWFFVVESTACCGIVTTP